MAGSARKLLKTNWLPERYAETELRIEKTGENTFSRVLTREGVSKVRLI
jgi:hypothetical protein